ncbi:MAG: LexA family transcriptional regulator [Exiguobacterium sp.]|nr:LexA family transcriptional regulator [Exiguobacterium sp.]
MTFKEKLTRWKYDKRLTQDDIAEKVGVSRMSVAYWLAGKTIPKPDRLEKLAELMGVSASELLFGSESVVSNDEAQGEDFVSIPEFSLLNAAAGAGSDPDWEAVETSEKACYRADFFIKRGIKPDRCRRIKVRGDSMSPTLEDGDTVLFEDRYPIRISEIREGGIYVFATEMGLKIKRLYIGKKSLIARSDNAQYPAEEYEGEELNAIRIYGEVIEVSRTFR